MSYEFFGLTYGNRHYCLPRVSARYYFFSSLWWFFSSYEINLLMHMCCVDHYSDASFRLCRSTSLCHAFFFFFWFVLQTKKLTLTNFSNAPSKLTQAGSDRANIWSQIFLSTQQNLAAGVGENNWFHFQGHLNN